MTLPLSFSFPTGDDGLDSVQDYVGVPPKPPLAPRWNTFWTGGAALWGNVLYAHASHASDAVRFLLLFQQHGAGPCLPACEGCPKRCQ